MEIGKLQWPGREGAPSLSIPERRAARARPRGCVSEGEAFPSEARQCRPAEGGWRAPYRALGDTLCWLAGRMVNRAGGA